MSVPTVLCDFAGEITFVLLVSAVNAGYMQVSYSI